MKEGIVIPKHQTPRESERRSRAPYNFIPLPDKVVEAQDLPDQNDYVPGRLSGKIVCQLETKTPLYTRGALRPDFFKRFEQVRLETLQNDAELREYATFFRYDEHGAPVISGSSLRGMARGLAEILAYGKVQWVTDKKLIYRAVGAISSVGDYYRRRFFGANKDVQMSGKTVTQIEYPARWVRGGYLRIVRSDWFIQPAAEDAHGNSFIHVNYDDCAAAGLMGAVRYGPDGRLDNRSTYRPDAIAVQVQPAPHAWTNPNRYGGRLFSFCLAQTSMIQRDGNILPPGWMRGKLVLSHHFGPRADRHPKHRNIVIYHPDPNKAGKQDWLPLSDEQVALLKEEDRLPRNSNQQPRSHWLADGSPVMYMVDDQDQVVCLGPTKMFRLPYLHTPLDYVPAKLRDPHMIDMAEAVFGFVRGDAPPPGESDEQAKRRAYAGRVFFGDAKLQKAAAPQPVVLLDVLSSPKPTSFQHYLVQQAAGDNTVTRGKDLKHYDDDSAGMAIRGSKQYWHQSTATAASHMRPVGGLADLSVEERKSRTVAQPVGQGAQFEFCVRFENLTREELGMLLWSLELPADEGYAHRLGMAKPLGLGSVKITPALYIDDRAARYTSLFNATSTGWSGEPVEVPDRAQYVRDFEAYVMQALGKASQPFAAEERIQHLLAMLRLSGPPADAIRYSTLDEREFQEHKVLPLPCEVSQAPGAGGSQPPAGGGGGGRPPQQGGGGGRPPQQPTRPGGSGGRLTSNDFLEEMRKRQGG